MPSYSQAKGHDGRWGVMASDLVGRPLHRARGGHDLLIRRSMESVRSVRRSPYPQARFLPVSGRVAIVRHHPVSP